MWKKRQKSPEEGGIRIPESTGGGRRQRDRISEVPAGSVRKKARGQIVFTAVFFSALFAVMSVYFCWYAAAHRRELFDNDYNSRDTLLEDHNRRGRILAVSDENGDWEALAWSDGDNRRHYPYGAEFCHVVGYSMLGGSGIEEYMKYELLHSDIPFSEKLNCDHESLRYPGNDVYTTLNIRLQEAAYEALGDYRGAVIVTEPSTGRILAMVSKSDFDPNALADPDQVYTEWDRLRSDDSGDAPLLNRATQGVYPPGPTFKIVDAIELLQEDPSAFERFSFDCDDGVYENGEDSIHCFDYERHGTQDLAAAFAHSCNSAFASIVTEDLDQDSFRRTLKKLLFNQALPYDLPYTGSHSQLLEDENISIHNLMQVAIGQGTTEVSPLHMNMITMAVANGGVLMRPYLIDSVTTSGDEVLEDYEAQTLQTWQPAAAGNLIDEDTAWHVRQLMRGVTRVTYTEDGTEVWGTASMFDGSQTYTAFGKTGTAEFGDEKDSHAWFTGFSVDSREGEDGTPDLCITVLIENGGVGSDKAVPVAKNILDAWYHEP